jgi:hypothetical protein
MSIMLIIQVHYLLTTVSKANPIGVLWVMMSTGQHTQGTSTLVLDGFFFLRGVPAHMIRREKGDYYPCPQLARMNY